MTLSKYNIPVPRYTSYPTVPMWDQERFSIDGYLNALKTTFWESSKEVSLYIHLPFCESLCTYCACNTRITKNHGVEKPYIQYLLKEWQLYLQEFPQTPTIKAIHLGGGTPTFFSPENLSALLLGITDKANLAADCQMSFEGHPTNTTKEHLKALCAIGFDRLSLGIQDFDPKVQRLINRRQSFEQVKTVTDQARDIGYKSVNYDMVYGLPGQTIDSLVKTMDQVNELSPDRIAFYSYAHVPKLKPAQKSFEAHLPDSEEKFLFMNNGKEMLKSFGYEEVGMDHFVKPADELKKAANEGGLHRNFMGYTTQYSHLLVGLGVSSISDAWTGFAQNEKTVEGYYRQLDQGFFPIAKGHLLTNEDLFYRNNILNLMCRFETHWSEQELMTYGMSMDYDLLEQLRGEGYISFDKHGIHVNESGKELIRVICSSLDVRVMVAREGGYHSRL